MKAMLAALALFLSSAAWSADGPPEEAAAETEVPVATHVARQLQVVAEVSIVAPQTMTLFGPRYEVPYADNFTGMPSMQLGVALPLFLVGPIEAQAIGLVGYGLKEGYFDLRTVEGAAVRDRLRLHRAPFTAGMKFLYHISWMSFVKPTLTVAAGTQWLHQVGHLPGIDQTAWVPFYSISPALTFFESRASADWFGGFSFGVSYQNDLDSRQIVRAWSFDLSVNLFL